ncbi:MAG: hypothetical protein ACYCVD_15745 [Desulfitobacteriaceae bacterium]
MLNLFRRMVKRTTSKPFRKNVMIFIIGANFIILAANPNILPVFASDKFLNIIGLKQQVSNTKENRQEKEINNRIGSGNNETLPNQSTGDKKIPVSDDSYPNEVDKPKENINDSNKSNPRELTPKQTSSSDALIIYPKNGMELEPGNLTVTWTNVKGATGYTAELQDLTGGFQAPLQPTLNVTENRATFPAERIIQGHKYTLKVYIKTDSGSIGYDIPSYMQPVTFSVKQNAVITLNYPQNNSTFRNGTAVKVSWTVPPGGEWDVNEVQVVRADSGYSFSMVSGGEIPQYMLAKGRDKIVVWGRNNKTGEFMTSQVTITITD